LKNCSFCDEPTDWAQLLDDGKLLCPACRPCIFFENYLTLTGDFSGHKFNLIPWIRVTLRDVFGTLDSEGLRQYKDVYLEIPTSNSKTTFAAGLVLFFLCDCGQGTEIYSAATAKEQSAITFRMAHQMVIQSPMLRSVLSVIPSTKRIVRRDDPTSFYAALSADGDIHDGINPSFVVRDELHRWRTRKQLELNDVLERKILKRRNPLIWDITTAGDQDESPLCWRRHEYARSIQEGVFTDARFYGRIWAADPKRIEKEDDYWTTREARVEANPSHEENGGFLKDSVLADLCVKAQNDPKTRGEYLRFNLNFWGQTDEAVIDMPRWIACGGEDDLRMWPEYDVDLLIKKWGLIDRTCYAGVDASWTTDLTSLVLVFPPVAETDPVILLPFFWMPEERIKERERKDKVPYADWVRRKFIESIPGSSIDLAVIKDKIRWATKLFDVREVPYDPWSFRDAAKELYREGIEMVEVPQNYSMLSAPTKRLLAWYLDGKIRHGNHPVLNWNARCLALQGDHKDNVQPTKPERAKSSKRIDGMSATITAMARAILMEPVQLALIEHWG
jgi:phage terminase large subunit-like protein